jgi:hypothetical protein
VARRETVAGTRSLRFLEISRDGKKVIDSGKPRLNLPIRKASWIKRLDKDSYFVVLSPSSYKSEEKSGPISQKS